jgi:hypothetical protein
MKNWNILRAFGVFYGHLLIFWSFGITSPVLVYCPKKNLATLDKIIRALFAREIVFFPSAAASEE